MEDRAAADVFGKRLAGFHERAHLKVRHVAGGADLTVQINNVAHLELFNLGIINGQIKFVRGHRYSPT